MKKNNITLLAIVTVVIVVASVMATFRDDSSAASEGQEDTLLPGLADRLNDVGTLHLVQGDKQVTVELRDVGWGVAERSYYPAQFETVKALVLQLSELSIVEPKTAKADLYEKLGLGDPQDPESMSTLVELRDRAGETMASVVFSKPAFKRESQEFFVRHTGDPQSYACTTRRLSLNADPLSWIDRELIRLDDGRVVRAEVEHADGETLVVERSPNANDQFVIDDVPAGKKESYPGIANSFATALSYLRLSDVKPIDEVDFADPIATATFRTYEGLVVKIETVKVGEKYWIRILPSFDPPPLPEGDDADSVRAKQEDAAKEVRKYERNFGRWAYELPEAKGQTLTKRQVDFLVDENPPSPLLDASDDEDASAPDGSAPDAGGDDAGMDDPGTDDPDADDPGTDGGGAQDAPAPPTDGSGTD